MLLGAGAPPPCSTNGDTFQALCNCNFKIDKRRSRHLPDSGKGEVLLSTPQSRRRGWGARYAAELHRSRTDGGEDRRHQNDTNAAASTPAPPANTPHTPRSKDEADRAIDRYLTERKNLTMGIGLSEVDKIIQKCRFFPDGTKKRLKAGQAIDKRRDTTYQLVQAVVYKYNDHHKLFGDSAYEVKDVLGEPPLWEEDNCRMYMHMNFTAKTKGRDDLFFAEVTYVSGDAALAVNCCCIVKSFDNGPCFACGTTMKHPSDGIAYSGGRRNGSYCLPFGSGPVRATWCHDEDSDEEVERLRSLFGGARATARVPLEA